MMGFREGGAGAFIREGAMLTSQDIEWYAVLGEIMSRANRGSRSPATKATRVRATPQVKAKPLPSKLSNPKFKPSVRWHNPSF